MTYYAHGAVYALSKPPHIAQNIAFVYALATLGEQFGNLMFPYIIDMASFRIRFYK